MTAAARQGRALFLALVGAHGLVVAALAHSEEHLREQQEDQAQGSGTLSHLAVVLHAAPALPGIAPRPPEHAAPAPLVAQLRATLRYLNPERAQGPPASR